MDGLQSSYRNTASAYASTWNAQLAECQSIQAVLAVVRDYLALLSPAELAAIPEPLRPRSFANAAELADFAFEITRHYCDSETSLPLPIAKLQEFFCSASNRAAQLGRVAANAPQG
jgi:hypothetical protein